MHRLFIGGLVALVGCGGVSAGDGESPSAAGASSGSGAVSGIGGAGSTAGAGASAGAPPSVNVPSPQGGAGAAVAEGDAGAGGEGVDLALGAGDLTLLVVFDRSGSMGSLWDERTRWQVANEALMKAIEGVIDNLTLAAILFPEPGDCSVAEVSAESQLDFLPGRQFASAWQERVVPRVPEGSTPLELSFRAADQAIARAAELGLLSDRFRVVLVTDGEPTCSDDPQIITNLAAAWHERGIETCVMGLPGSAAAHALLDDIAEAGGTGQHQSLGTPSELDDGLYEAAR